MENKNTSNITEKVMQKNIRFWSSFGKRVFTFSKSPTMVWFYSLYFSSLIAMILFNIVREGLTFDGLFNGPAYYADLFFFYGLNKDSVYSSPWVGGFLAWLSAPLMAIFLGIPLFFLNEAGWAYSSPPAGIDPGTKFYAYFNSDDVYGYSIHIFGLKGNMFFIGIMWLPILSATFITYFYKKRTSKNTNIVPQFFIGLLISLLLSSELSRFSSPNWGLSFEGFWESLFSDRQTNSFVQYDTGSSGLYYHPLSTGLFMGFFHIVPIAVAFLVETSITVFTKLKLRLEASNKRRAQIQSELATEGIQELPWASGTDISAVPTGRAGKIIFGLKRFFRKVVNGVRSSVSKLKLKLRAKKSKKGESMNSDLESHEKGKRK